MTTTPPGPILPDPIITSGIEYNITPGSGIEDGPNASGSWAGVSFNNLPESIVLNGFRVGARPFTETCTPQVDIDGNPVLDLEGENIFVCTRTHSSWEVLEQTLVKSSPDRQVFGSDEGTELFVTEPRVYGAGEYTSAGITDGTEYEYTRVFDQSDISYWPRASTPDQPIIENPTTMPSGDDKYLIDTLTSFVPDPRESVTVTYVLTTRYRKDNMSPENTDTLTITQSVQQNIDDVGEKIQAYLERSYYTDGKYHIQLHDADQPNLYDEGGELIRPQDYKVPEYQETSEGYLKLINSVTPVTPDDILKETLNTSVEELNKLINMIDDYEFPE